MGLNIHNLYEQDISWLGSLDLERSGEVVDSCEINILDIISTVIVTWIDVSKLGTRLSFDIDQSVHQSNRPT